MSKPRTHSSTRAPLIDRRMAKALVHPLRIEILDILNRRVASPNQIATELGEPLGSVAYHVRILLELECIELVGTKPRRGALEHFYRAIARPFFSDSDLEKMPASTRRSVTDVFLRAVWQDVNEAVESGSIHARNDTHLSHSRIVVDEEGWEELHDMLEAMLDRIPEIEAESAGRLAATKEDGMPARCTLMHFLAAAPTEQQGADR